MRRFRNVSLLLPLILAAIVNQLPAQSGDEVVRVEAHPGALEMAVGETLPVHVVAIDGSGNEVDAEFRFAAPRAALHVASGEVTEVTALEAGDHEIVASVFSAQDRGRAGDPPPPSVTIPVSVRWNPITEVRINAGAERRLYAGTTLRHRAAALHGDGSQRPRPDVRWTSSDPAVASVDRFGNVTAHSAGPVVIAAEVEGTRGVLEYDVPELNASRLEIVGGASEARTGDVLSFTARVLDAEGREIHDVPVTWSHTYLPDDSIASAPEHAGGSGMIRVDGRFVGELPGEYAVLAHAAGLSDRKAVDVRSRDVVRPVRKVGQGRMNHYHTSDFWVFEGRDGRDYAITGTWGGDGYAFMWDVTDPANIVLTDSVQVDARTINDVKVSPDARYATMTREGASNRRNGVVILDLADPAHPVIASMFDEGLTGGVHNAFPTEDYLFALSAGEKYVIIDVRDIYNPRYVGEYQHPNARIHDVWLKNGIAYSAQSPRGGVIVDVGEGGWGGTPENPRLIADTGPTTEGGGGHGVFPYRSDSTGRMLLFMGDEILSRPDRPLGAGLGRTLNIDPYDQETDTGGTPSMSAGYIHIFDIEDPENPELIARYQVPEYGTHNSWVEDGILYQAYYEGGARMVDVSGELMGNLATQGREIAVFKSHDPAGYIANAPMVWSVMPHKGHIFFSDWNSGLWAIKMED